MKMKTVVQLAEAEMTVLFKACVSFHFRAMKDLQNNVITTLALRERKLSSEMFSKFPLQLFLTSKCFSSKTSISISNTCRLSLPPTIGPRYGNQRQKERGLYVVTQGQLHWNLCCVYTLQGKKESTERRGQKAHERE